MSLITPDFGLIFWMVVIFGAVFFILAKFGFPIITGMVGKRSAHIADSLKEAERIREESEAFAEQQRAQLEQTRSEQAAMLREACAERDRIIAKAKLDASAEAAGILEKARQDIATERDNALRDIRSTVAMLSVEMATKVLSSDLADENEQRKLLGRLSDEVSSTTIS